jgi:hypothetical protein
MLVRLVSKLNAVLLHRAVQRVSKNCLPVSVRASLLCASRVEFAEPVLQDQPERADQPHCGNQRCQHSPHTIRDIVRRVHPGTPRRRRGLPLVPVAPAIPAAILPRVVYGTDPPLTLIKPTRRTDPGTLTRTPAGHFLSGVRQVWP